MILAHTLKFDLLLALSFPYSQAFSSKDLNFPFTSSSDPKPFHISVNRQFIEETTLKVKLYRPSRDIQVADWSDGVPGDKLSAVADYWANEYRWSAIQGEINANFSHYTITVPGNGNYLHPIPLHFIHHRSPRSDATPLLLLHGWPSSFLEWSKIISGLISPPNSSLPAFHIIAPTLPGFGFSPAPEFPGLGSSEMGHAFDALMKKLGYHRYALYSTDLGFAIAAQMISDVASSILAHMTDFYMIYPDTADQQRFALNQTTEEENAYIAASSAWAAMDSGYSVIQSTRPLSIAQAMTDSPVGFLGWIWQLMNTLGDGYVYTPEELITNAMMLFIQGTYGNFRMYKEVCYPHLLLWKRSGILGIFTERYVS